MVPVMTETDSNTISPEVQEIVALIDGVPRADSRIICKKLNLEHNKFLNNILYKYQEDFEQFGHLPFEKATVTNSVGAVNQQVYALLNENQSNLALTYVRNTDEARACKIDLIKGFAYYKQETLKPKLPSYSEALRELADTLDKNAALEQENKVKSEIIEVQAPKVESYDRWMHAKNGLTMKAAFENFGIGHYKGMEVLRNHKVLGTKDHTRNLPIGEYRECEGGQYFKVIRDGNNFQHTLVLPRGMNLIESILKEKDLIAESLKYELVDKPLFSNRQPALWEI